MNTNLIEDNKCDDQNMETENWNVELSGEIINSRQYTNENLEGEISNLTKTLNSTLNFVENEEIYWQTWEWKSKQHIFILSSAGKPIYSRYGNEDDLVTLFGVMQAIVSVVLDSNDELYFIHTSNKHFSFLRKESLLLVSVSQLPSNSDLSIMRLNYIYNQIISILTLTQLTRIFQQYNNFDLRRLLSGSERLINSFIDFTENEPGFFLNSVECLPLSSSVRDNIAQAIISSCQKIRNLLFAILLAENQLIIIIRMKKYFLLPSDLHLIFNLVSSSQSFRTAEGWTPICLPYFDASGYMQAHVSYLSEECQACLLLLTVDRELFFILSEAKQKIVEKLDRNALLQQIKEAMKKPKIFASEFNVPKLRHFIYKNKNTNQFVFPQYEVPYHIPEKQNSLLLLYCQLCQQLNKPFTSLKLLFQQLKTETVLGWDTKGIELYLIFEPFVTKPEAINAVNKLLKYIKKDEDKLFIVNSPTF